MSRYEANREVFLALSRIRSVVHQKHRHAKKVPDRRDIRLDLSRIKLVVSEEQPWKGVHVGGTNGKGSVCAFLAGLFKLAGVGHGMFTSPAFPEPHNGVLINGRFANKRMYEAELGRVREIFHRYSKQWTLDPDSRRNVGKLSPFELETATAFRVFDQMHVEYGIVEVGMGGEMDATNVMKEKSVTVITKIDLDHQEYLGNTIEKIAKVKAGIMRRSVPCIVDDSNSKEVIKVLRNHAKSIGTQIHLSRKAQPILDALDMTKYGFQEYQKQNLLCALLAFRHLFPTLPIDAAKLLKRQPFLPGRMENVNVSKLTDGLRERTVLVDGAHNMLGIQALAAHVDGRLREGDEPVTWIMGLSSSKSKPFAELIEKLIRPQDNFAFVEFVPGPNDPQPAPSELGRDHAKTILNSEDQIYEDEPTLDQAIQWASEKADGGPIVITGSLYLIRELYKLPGIQSSRMPRSTSPGRSQLWHYILESRKRQLTPEEAKEFKLARRHWYLSPVRSPVFRKDDPDQPHKEQIRPGVPQAQRKAAWHKTQAEECTALLKMAKKDLADPELNLEQNDGSPGLLSYVKQMEDMAKEHKAEAESAMRIVRGQGYKLRQRPKTYEEVFNMKPSDGLANKAGSSLFLNYKEPGLVKGRQSVQNELSAKNALPPKRDDKGSKDE